MKNKGKIIFEMPGREDSIFDCELATNTKFFSAFFAIYIWQYNKTTRFANENVYGYPNWDKNEEPVQ